MFSIYFDIPKLPEKSYHYYQEWIKYHCKLGIRYIFISGNTNFLMKNNFIILPLTQIIVLPKTRKLDKITITKLIKIKGKKVNFKWLIHLNIEEDWLYIHLNNIQKEPSYILKDDKTKYIISQKKIIKNNVIQDMNIKEQLYSFENIYEKGIKNEYIQNYYILKFEDLKINEILTFNNSYINMNKYFENRIIPEKNITNCIASTEFLKFKFSDLIHELPLQKSVQTFQKYGLVIFSEAIVDEITNDITAQSKTTINKYIKILQKDFKGKHSKIHKHTNIASRKGGRYEIKPNLEEPFINKKLISPGNLIPFLKIILDTKRIEIDTLSIITSLPKSKLQHWHRDIEPLYKNIKEYIPPVGIVMVVAMEDVPLHKGPTHFLLSSHKTHTSKANILYENWSSNKLSTECNEVVIPELKKGDILIFDLRLMHRGGENTSTEFRNIMYISYMNEWFTDRINFNSKQTKSFDNYEKGTQLLLSRVNEKKYNENVEFLLNDKGTQTKSLQSSYSWGARFNLN